MNTESNTHLSGLDLMKGAYLYLSYLAWAAFLLWIGVQIPLALLGGWHLISIFEGTIVQKVHTVIVFSGPGFALYIWFVRMASLRESLRKNPPTRVLKTLETGHLLNIGSVLMFSAITLFWSDPYFQAGLIVTAGMSFLFTCAWEHYHGL